MQKSKAWNSRLKDNAGLTIEERNEIVAKGRQEANGKFMIRQIEKSFRMLDTKRAKDK